MRNISNIDMECGIINYWWCNDNGAILTAYALQQTLYDMGYENQLINLDTDEKNYGISKRFRKYMHVTAPVVNDEDFYNLNKSFTSFIVGSDQVFRAEWVSNHWFLDFVNDDKNKIAISASYGKNTLDVSKKRELEIRYLLSRFNSISVREKQGVDLSRKLGVKAVNIIDPVFYLSKNEYIEKLNIKSDANSGKYIFVYFRDLKDNKIAICENYARSMQCDLFYADDNTQVEIFLEKLLNSEIVITDSYHGLCFSLIFNKNYICIVNEMRGLERFNSLRDTFGLNEKCFIDEKISPYELEYEIHAENWEKLNHDIGIKSCEAKKWIFDALEKKKKTNKLRILIKLFNLKKYIFLRKISEYIKNVCSYIVICASKKYKKDNIILFGAGLYGQKAAKQYNGRILFFIDNSKNKKWIAGYPVFTLKKASKFMNKNKKIIITTSPTYQNEILQQLTDNGYVNVEKFKDVESDKV